MTSRKEARNAALGLGLAGVASKQELAPANLITPADAIDVHSKSSQEPRARLMASAVGAVSRTLDQFQHELQAAKELVASGAHIIEIDPVAIESSPVKDRLEIDLEQQAILVESIRRSGQQSPVLVRRIGESPARYQLAYGHRRVQACHELGRKVLAIVRPLDDRELLVAQGQENSSRTDLSYIERAIFAFELEKRAVPRETIMLALATDKTELSKMISVARAIPSEVIISIGPAPKAGRTRWLGLAERLGQAKIDAATRAFLSNDEFRAAPSDARFEKLFKRCSAAPKGRDVRIWANGEGRSLVRGVRSNKAMTLTVDEKLAPGFGDFLFSELPAIYETFRERKVKLG